MEERYDLDDYNEMLAWVAAGLTMAFYLPKIAPFINVLQGLKDSEDTPKFYTIITYVNAFFWFLYGDLLFSDQMRLSYMVACIICLISIGIYLIFEIKKDFVDMILNLIIIVSVSWGIYCYFTIDFDDDKLLGKICIASSLMFYCFPIYTIIRVIREKNAKLIHIYNISIYFLGVICWFVYGIIDKDYFIAFPYLLGGLIALTQIILYRIYTRKYMGLRIGKNLMTNTIGIENNEKNEENNSIENKINFEVDIKNLIKERPVKIIS